MTYRIYYFNKNDECIKKQLITDYTLNKFSAISDRPLIEKSEQICMAIKHFSPENAIDYLMFNKLNVQIA